MVLHSYVGLPLVVIASGLLTLNLGSLYKVAPSDVCWLINPMNTIVIRCDKYHHALCSPT